eukprot:TRINITY_DN7845_c1_g1_i1.p1 TRINITY_DN7845_c1_g1~~TRINITY_DN7845_c1_g1_i1.p1  ORF type:complete len:729 (+),score=151.83 TRINITY_DN7845_c1_g1_i1:66-2252(+)
MSEGNAKGKDKKSASKPAVPRRGVGGGFTKNVQIHRGPLKFAVFESKRAKPKQAWQKTPQPKDDTASSDSCSSRDGDSDSDVPVDGTEQGRSASVASPQRPPPSDSACSGTPQQAPAEAPEGRQAPLDWGSLEDEGMDFSQPLPGMQAPRADAAPDKPQPGAKYRPGAGLRPPAPKKGVAAPPAAAGRVNQPPVSAPPVATKPAQPVAPPPDRAQWGTTKAKAPPPPPQQQQRVPPPTSGGRPGPRERADGPAADKDGAAAAQGAPAQSGGGGARQPARRAGAATPGPLPYPAPPLPPEADVGSASPPTPQPPDTPPQAPGPLPYPLHPHNLGYPQQQQQPASPIEQPAPGLGYPAPAWPQQPLPQQQAAPAPGGIGYPLPAGGQQAPMPQPELQQQQQQRPPAAYFRPATASPPLGPSSLPQGPPPRLQQGGCPQLPRGWQEGNSPQPPRRWADGAAEGPGDRPRATPPAAAPVAPPAARAPPRPLPPKGVPTVDELLSASYDAVVAEFPIFRKMMEMQPAERRKAWIALWGPSCGDGLRMAVAKRRDAGDFVERQRDADARKAAESKPPRERGWLYEDDEPGPSPQQRGASRSAPGRSTPLSSGAESGREAPGRAPPLPQAQAVLAKEKWQGPGGATRRRAHRDGWDNPHQGKPEKPSRNEDEAAWDKDWDGWGEWDEGRDWDGKGRRKGGDSWADEGGWDWYGYGATRERHGSQALDAKRRPRHP